MSLKRKMSKPKTTKRNFNLPDLNAPPLLSLLAKLGSIIVHIEEASSTKGHAFDWIAIQQLIADPEVQDWLKVMRTSGFLPVKR